MMRGIILLLFFFLRTRCLILGQVTIDYRFSDKPDYFLERYAKVESSASDSSSAVFIVQDIQEQLKNEGFLTVSVDSMLWSENHLTVKMFAGRQFVWGELITDANDLELLDEIRFRTSTLYEQSVSP